MFLKSVYKIFFKFVTFLNNIIYKFKRNFKTHKSYLESNLLVKDVCGEGNRSFVAEQSCVTQYASNSVERSLFFGKQLLLKCVLQLKITSDGLLCVCRNKK